MKQRQVRQWHSPAALLPFATGLVLVVAVSVIYLVRNLDGSAYISSDAQAFLFWMDAWRDGSPFQSDPLAPFFERRSPMGYKALFFLGYSAGLSPKDAAAALPMLLCPLLYLGTFQLLLLTGATSTIVSGTAAAFTLYEFPASGTPREFAAPILVFFLLVLIRRSVLGVPAVIAAGALFYPIASLICCGAVGSLIIKRHEGRLIPDFSFRTLSLILLSALAAVAAVLAQAGPQWNAGDTITFREAVSDPIFQPDGRNAFFFPDLKTYLLCGMRSGLLDFWWCRQPLVGSVFLGGLAAFALLLLVRRKGSIVVDLLPRLFVSSIALFGAAHISLFYLYLPSRYTKWSFALISLICVAIVADAAIRKLVNRRVEWIIVTSFIVMLAAMVSIRWQGFISRGLSVRFEHSEILNGIDKLKPGEAVASLQIEASAIPLLSRRRVVTAHEHFFGYHRHFREMMVRRTRDVVDAVYLDNWPRLLDFMNTYEVGAFLVHQDFQQPQHWLRAWWSPNISEKTNQIRSARMRGVKSVLESVVDRCTTVKQGFLLLIDADCVKRNAPRQ